MNKEGSNCLCNGRNCDEVKKRSLNEMEMRELLLSLGLDDLGKFYSFPRLYLNDNVDGDQSDPFVLQPSLFHGNHVPPTIYFETKLNQDTRPPVGLPKCLQPFFRWKISTITPNSIRNCIYFMRFDHIKPSNTSDTSYLGSWCKHMLTSDFSRLEEWRKVNHYPGSFHLGRKDKLWVRLRSKQKIGQELFENFHPMTFVLPRDYEELKNYWENSPNKLFIMKPPASARGNGIKVINDITQIPSNALISPPDGLQNNKKSTMIVQQYISNPLLLENGQKFDLRVYVLLSSIDPLRIYVYDEGLVRFASTKYTSQEDGIINQYMHLTNYFVNKKNREYQINNDCDSLAGCKWTLKRFWQYLREHYTHIDSQKLWNDIIDIIIKTIIRCEGPMARLSNQNCKNDYTSFELFGFDIILDENFKPWILEVNITPSLKSESDLDTSVKYKVIRDMFNLVGYNLPPANPEQLSRLGELAGCRLFFDRRLYTQNLTKNDKIKHSKYLRLHKNELQIIKSKHAIGSDQNQENNSESSTLETAIISPTATVDDSLDHSSSQSRSSHSKTNDTNNDDGENSNEEAENSDTILDNLSQDDVRVLMLAEDELSRCGLFKRVFPSATSNDYLKFFDKQRYYNLLLDSWEQRYKNNRVAGIRHLSNLATFLDP